MTTTDYVAPVDPGASRDVSDLDRADLRRALRLHTCFVSLPTGLRELCEEMVKGRKPREIKGLTNPYAK